MDWRNKYCKIAFWGILITFILQLILTLTVDPYVAAVLSPFYSVWIILLVIGWRNKHPRK
jgi:hypothetical protein